MRPRVFPAEDTMAMVYHGGIHPASMRPRVFPAEDVRLARDPGNGIALLQ